MKLDIINRQLIFLIGVLLSSHSITLGQSVKSYQDLAQQQFESKAYEQALYNLEKGLELDPNNTRLLFRSGRVLVKLERYDEAMERISHSIDYDSTDIVKYDHMEQDSSIAGLWQHARWGAFMRKGHENNKVPIWAK